MLFCDIVKSKLIKWDDANYCYVVYDASDQPIFHCNSMDEALEFLTGVSSKVLEEA